MILTNVLWPLFAFSSWTTQPTEFDQSQTPEIAMDLALKEKYSYPGHTLYKLNDGNIFPSPAWGTGTGSVRGTNATADVLRALKAGWRHIDTSLNYGNQVGTGIAIRESGLKREEIYVTSKYDAIDNHDALTEIETTLKQLQLTHLDLYLIHFPGASTRGGGIRKIWSQMQEIQKKGLARSIGVSNWDSVGLLEELYGLGGVKPAVNQIQYSVYNAIDLAPALAVGLKNDLLFTAWGELAPITRTPNGPADPTGQAIAKRLSKTYGKEVTYAQMIFSWLRSVGVGAITTTSNEDRLKEQLVPFADDFPLLTAAEVRAWEYAGIGYKPNKVVGYDN